MHVRCFLCSYLQPAVGTVVVPWNVVTLCSSSKPPRQDTDQHIALLNPVSRAWKCEGSGRREKVHAAAKNSNHLSRSGKSIGKGSEKTKFNPVASPMAPWSGSSLTPLLGSGQISVLSLSTLPSLQHCPHHLNRSPSASPLTCTWAGTITIP